MSAGFFLVIFLGVLGLVLRGRYASWVASRDIRRRLLSDREKLIEKRRELEAILSELIEKRRELEEILNDPDVSRAGLYSDMVSAIRNNDIALREVFARVSAINMILSTMKMIRALR